ncbi:MAG TPA: M15 family metallopeptidase [Thermohalobaculum sp.]|nr:M15 family metallopeptidase [Thermohalobaculum sp.]
MARRSVAGPLIAGASVVVAALIAVMVWHALDLVDSGLAGRVERQEAAMHGLERDLVALRSRVDALEEENRRLATRVQLLESAGGASAPVAESRLEPGVVETEPIGEGEIVDVLEPRRPAFNKQLTRARQSYLRVVLGEPRTDYGDDCRPPSNERLLGLLETREIGPIRVTMIRPALDSLARVLDRLRRDEPEIYAALGTAGALCARRVRGANSISTHSWGVAVDLTLAGKLDPYGDDGSQFGLLVLAEFFNDEGWYWGAGYAREDAMHFEVSEEKLREWAEQNLL